MRRSLATLALATTLGSLSAAAGAAELAGKRPCTPAERAEFLSPPAEEESASLSCSLSLSPADRVRRRVVIEGAQASGVTLDCNGATLGVEGGRANPTEFTVQIRSRRVDVGGPPRWERPTDVTLRDCTILGHVRISGMGLNGQGPDVRESSRSLGHTGRTQAAAPTRVRIEASRLVAQGAIPLYLAPGVTDSALVGSQVTGRSSSVAVYLDAESAGNTIAGNAIDATTGREVIAVDGSAGNRILDNRIVLHGEGGIRLYRNCGEGGTVRHQTPSDNVVTGNRFRQAGFLRPAAIVVGSRDGWNLWKLFCGADDGYPFGSSIDDGDHAERNRVENNAEE